MQAVEEQNAATGQLPTIDVEVEGEIIERWRRVDRHSEEVETDEHEHWKCGDELQGRVLIQDAIMM